MNSFDFGQSLWCPFCGSVYEDAPSNYLINFTFIDGVTPTAWAQWIGLNSASDMAFRYQYHSAPTNSLLTNISGRGFVGTGDNVLISGFIVGDVGSDTVVVRALGPSLASFGVSQPLSDPILTIYDSKGSAIATNDNCHDDPNAIFVQRNGLVPPNALESAIVLHLPAGSYTAIVRGANGATGNALV